MPSNTELPPPPPRPASPLVPASAEASRSVNARATNNIPSPSLSRLKSPDVTPRQGNMRHRHKTALTSAPGPTLLESVSKRSPLIEKVPVRSLKSPSKCPLFCCFYAEFDNKLGPKICFQSPREFMDRDISLPLDAVHALLRKTFLEMLPGDSEESHVDPPQSSTDDATSKGLLGNRSDASNKASSSVFESCGEFIIAGGELTENIINLSTHRIHVLTRPAVIVDERYERNSLLFCVGFILRRTEDPRPFRSVLSKTALTFREMERESQFLSNQRTRQEIQVVLDHVLISLNSSGWECGVLMNPANFLSLKLFHPPKPPATTVPHFAVPILLRRDWQVQSYEWDLAINWVSLHIDGYSTAKQIADQAEVDMEMVQACLRVLKHHGVIALVDVFFFSNRYDATEKVTQLFEDKSSRILGEAAEYIVRRLHDGHDGADNSPSLNSMSSFGDRTPTPVNVAASYPPEHKDSVLGRFGASLTSTASFEFASQHTNHSRHDLDDVKLAVAEIFSACTRASSWSELWVDLISGEKSLAGYDSEFWSKMFALVDHRRFTSFGVVHGFLNRIHEFPLILEGDLQSSPIESCMDGKHCDDELSAMFQLPFAEMLDVVGCDRVTSVFASV